MRGRNKRGEPVRCVRCPDCRQLHLIGLDVPYDRGSTVRRFDWPYKRCGGCQASWEYEQAVFGRIETVGGDQQREPGIDPPEVGGAERPRGPRRAVQRGRARGGPLYSCTLARLPPGGKSAPRGPARRGPHLNPVGGFDCGTAETQGTGLWDRRAPRGCDVGV